MAFKGEWDTSYVNLADGTNCGFTSTMVRWLTLAPPWIAMFECGPSS